MAVVTIPYVTQLAGWIGRALGRSEELFAAFTTEAAGMRLPEAVIGSPAVTGALEQAKARARDVAAIAEEITAAPPDAEVALLAAFTRFGVALTAYFSVLDTLATQIKVSITPATIPDAGIRAKALTFAGTLALRLGERAIATYIAENNAPFAMVLKLIGLLRWEKTPPDPANPFSSGNVVMALELHRLKNLIDDPPKHLRDTLRWGEPDFDPSTFLEIFNSFFTNDVNRSLIDFGGDPGLSMGNFVIRRQSALVPPGIEIRFDALPPPIDLRTPITDEWGIGLKTTVTLNAGASLTLKPPLEVNLTPNVGPVSGELKLYANRNETARPFSILPTGLINLTADDAQFSVGFKADAIGAANSSVTPLIAAKLSGGKIRLGSDDADGFIGKLLAGAQIQGEFDLGLEWNAKDGLLITGSGGIEIAIPVHRSIGLLDIDKLYVALRIKSDGTLGLETSAGLTGNLGPLKAIVDRVGVELDLRFAEGADARFGPFDLALHFKPPNGVGLVIDAGVVSGGGYLFFDNDRQEYGGVMELSLAGIVTVKAIGLVTTRMPDGSRGFSLLVIITAEFGTGIQLGFGFTLLGVGGILGLNRTMSLQPLMDGVRSGSIQSIMFPANPVANAPRIISDLRVIFPPYPDRFLIGPMAKLGWGTPTLISVSLGIVIEITGNIAIVGVAKVAIPAEEAPLIVIQVNFAGAIEFDKQRLFFFAALFESRIVFLTLEGELGLLVAWGDDANFVLSAGGFHPRFNPPPLPFPNPRRIAVSLLNTDLARIRTETYFAITSNTVQVGAHTEIMVDVGVARVDGHMGFDALFQFSPFRFVVEISGSVSLKVFGVGLFGINLHFMLEGPSPYRAHGSGSISFFFFDVSADFDITWGESRDTTLPPLPVMPLLTGELKKLENWKAELPAGNNLLVSLRKLPPTESHVLHPLGSLRVSQRAVPLDLKIDKVGNQAPSDANLFKLTASGGLVRVGDADEQFAKAQFLKMSDADKLSLRAFDPLHGGLKLASGAQPLGASKLTRRRVRYEQHIIDGNYLKFRRYFGLAVGFFSHFARNGAVSNSKLSKSYAEKLDPFADKMKLREGGFSVVNQQDNRAFSTASTYFASEALAAQFIDSQVAANPALHDTLHVVPQHEAA